MIEHQSTVNPNMALRMLLYISRVLEKTIKGRSLYSERCLSIPWPEFYVLYNAKVRAFMEEGNSLKEAIKKAVKYCQMHGILKQFLENHSIEVLNMLLTEWNLEDAKKVWYEDGLEDGMEKGRKEKLKIACNTLAKGLTPEFIHDITGLDLETIQNLKR